MVRSDYWSQRLLRLTNTFFLRIMDLRRLTLKSSVIKLLSWQPLNEISFDGNVRVGRAQRRKDGFIPLETVAWKQPLLWSKVGKAGLWITHSVGEVVLRIGGLWLERGEGNWIWPQNKGLLLVRSNFLSFLEFFLFNLDSIIYLPPSLCPPLSPLPATAPHLIPPPLCLREGALPPHQASSQAHLLPLRPD